MKTVDNWRRALNKEGHMIKKELASDSPVVLIYSWI